MRYILARIIKNAQQTSWLRFKEMQTSRVIHKVDVSPFNSLALILFLFILEDMLRKMKMKNVYLLSRNFFSARDIFMSYVTKI